MSDFKTEIRVFIAAVVAFVAAYGVNAFFNSLLEACTREGQLIKARFWYMIAVLGLTFAVIYILVEYDDSSSDDDDSADRDSADATSGSDGSRTIKEQSKLNRSPLRRKLLKK